MEQKEETCLQQHILSLLNSPSPQVELKLLKQIHENLRQLSSEAVDCETENDLISSKLLDNDVNPYPDVSIEVLCKKQNVFNKITSYMFDRRFGWSEADQYDGRRVRRLSCTGATLQASDGQQKAALNDLLDDIIRW